MKYAELYKFRDNIELSETVVGRDILLLITGGEQHIGAASTAYVDGEQIKVLTSSVPHHKEHTLSEPIAMKVAEVLQRTVTVVIGIHYDDLTKEDILEVVKIVDNKIDEYLVKKLKR